MHTMRLANWPMACAMALFAALAAGDAVAAVDNSLRLKCVWELSQDIKTGLVQRVSGVQMLLFKGNGSTYFQLEVEGMPAPFLTSANDTYLTAEARYRSGATQMTEKLEVNRFTGAIRKWLRWGDSGSLYQGKCTKVTTSLF